MVCKQPRNIYFTDNIVSWKIISIIDTYGISLNLTKGGTTHVSYCKTADKTSV